jgi:hypothetical protein
VDLDVRKVDLIYPYLWIRYFDCTVSMDTAA